MCESASERKRVFAALLGGVAHQGRQGDRAGRDRPTIIINGGYGRIAASSDKNVNLVFRLNSDDFDEITLELGLADVNYLSQFTAQVPFSSFTDVNISLTPMMVPVDRVERR